MISITTDKNQLDVPFIHAFVSNSYWGKGRTPETMQICIDHSLNFGVFIGNQQIGYARVVTDYGQFAYLMDVFIDPGYRGNGYSKRLMNFILSHETLEAVKVWRLATTDAHGLYEQFGFKPLSKPENMMELMLAQ